ncbi:hypothetical protein Leryth_009419 [Lithospermum erythrorhizon]|nr:hypothetical protein Leryth_009419 [Lithospermum erythrorhizon]
MVPSSSSLAMVVGGRVVKKRFRSESPPPRRFKSMVEIMKVAKFVEVQNDDDDDDDGGGGNGDDGGGGEEEWCYGKMVCEECGSGEREDETLICDKCDKGFHMLCLRPIVVRVPNGIWLCPSCVNRPIKCFTQKKIFEFFRIQKSNEVNWRCEASQDIKKRRRRSGPPVFHKKRRRLLSFLPTEDPARRIFQLESLASALTALKMDYTDRLTYLPYMATKSANQAKFENKAMQILCKEDTETLEQCLLMLKNGLFPPLVVVFDPREGYTVEADEPIKDLTFIAEYTGDVDFLKNREHDDCDSMMTLLLATDPAKSLVVCPDKRGNIARFINGINNHSMESRKKQNLRCVRFNINGQCRVLLIANRDIAKGERLYYDYNGYEHEYPTHNFL